ncbi:hypothetical protein RvY_04305 [Ramazzottius varieornatus]|uniref:Flavin-containing monooxygenase n=1 Tax=Ramazzottius varieornatus TaxID=947166 RepID=A0A1D1UWY2_RAMVA|nr:hypothetical protein RvY_04305 [Ramazzottius varieornatus]
MSEGTSLKRVAVVGVGVCGLCVLRHFSPDPRYEVTAYEQRDRVGGIWNYPEGCEAHGNVPDEASPYFCRMYRHLRINVPRDLSHFREFPHLPDLPSFFSRSDLLRYLQRYTDHFDLKKHIKFRHQALSIEPFDPSVPHTCWRVRVKTLGDETETTETFDVVIVCNGHFNRPYIPRLAGIQSFKGKVIHSCDYRVPEPFADQRVLVVGGGPSARDIALEIIQAAKSVVITPSTYSSAYVETFPNVSITPLPVTFTQNGSLYTVPAKKAAADEEARQGQQEVDFVILGTGYQFDIPFIGQNCGVKVSRGRVTPLYRHIINCNHPSMAFIGLLTGLPVLGAGVEDQVLFYKAYLDGRMQLPSVRQMKQDCEREYRQRREKGLPGHDAHYMGAEPVFQYCRQLADEAGFPCVEPVAEDMFVAHSTNVQINPLNFREYEYSKTSADSFTTHKNPSRY